MKTVAEAAAIIRTYNPALADCWLRQPFRRLDLARAFAAGFAVNEWGEAPPVAYEVIRVALADREARLAGIGK